MPSPDREALARLEADGLLRPDGQAYRTTARWQAAMARAASRLFAAGAPDDDLRVPIACALLELYGAERPDQEVARLVDALLPVEAAELEPPAAGASAPG